MLLFFSPCVLGQTKVQPAASKPAPAGERRATLSIQAARDNPLQLHLLLLRMPKGADLHNHLGGAVYAESWIRAAAEDQLCVNPVALSFVKPQAAADNAASQTACEDGNVLAAQAYKDQHLYDALIDAFSMRGFVSSPGVTGHDHFFDTFAKFSGTAARHKGEWLDEVATRAAAQNEQYLELIEAPESSHTAATGRELGWNDDFSQMRDALLAQGLRDDIAVAREGFDRADIVRRERERCGMPDEAPACRVQIRYLYRVQRGIPKQQVFAQGLLAFETASAERRVVGVNLLMPEDGYTSMADYALHMRIVGFLHETYPKVHISLHAGELAPGLVPYEGLCCHIRLAVEQAHAERIGHGVDVMFEDRPHELMKEMAAKHVLVEISLTSNDVILGIRGKDHPFPMYRQFHVPVALATDDEGVSRINLTHEYQRAVETYGLSYADLKQMVRASLEHSFLPGASLWRERDVFEQRVSACAQDKVTASEPSSACATFLKSSEKAQQQWELERRFAAYEASL